MDSFSKYVIHHPDKNGFISYSDEEHRIWSMVFERQQKQLSGRACDEFVYGLKQLGFPTTNIPQLKDVNQTLRSLTGWQVTPIVEYLSFREFFEWLAARKFPFEAMIRGIDELNFTKEPDILHELFGHCPMLAIPDYADFVQQYAEAVLSYSDEYLPLLNRLYWFTVEFGLIRTAQGIRAYGAGILSSISETVYCIESDAPMRVLLDPVLAFRTRCRMDQLPSIYFVIDDFQELHNLVQLDLKTLMQRAQELGEYHPFFPTDEK